mmetsp:Transcript_2955/g.4314  ORF Transcript_2955/g.4314 Transcript_2955/m.4314 type:complete len:478 (-) Transcript_2955:33-1466(-)
MEEEESVSISLYDDLSRNFELEGNDIESLKYMEKALILREEILGKGNEEVVQAAENFIKKCNKMGMSLLRKEKYDESKHYLMKALKIVSYGYFGPHIEQRNKLSAISVNNLGCCYMQNGELKLALKCLMRTLLIENDSKNTYVANPSATHLNLCAINSKLNKHKTALKHAKKAIKFLEDNDSDTTNSVCMLGVAHHNLAVEYEFLRNYEAAHEHFDKAVSVSISSKGMNHKTTKSLIGAHKQFLKEHRNFKPSYKTRDIKPLNLLNLKQRVQLPQEKTHLSSRFSNTPRKRTKKSEKHRKQFVQATKSNLSFTYGTSQSNNNKNQKIPKNYYKNSLKIREKHTDPPLHKRRKSSHLNLNLKPKFNSSISSSTESARKPITSRRRNSDTTYLKIKREPQTARPSSREFRNENRRRATQPAIVSSHTNNTNTKKPLKIERPFKTEQNRELILNLSQNISAALENMEQSFKKFDELELNS